MEPVIEAMDLVKTYPPDVKALLGVSFRVERGEVFGLLGPNGAGKSTTVKILTTLTRADSGEARVAGFDVAKEPNAVRRTVGCVAQKSGVDPEATGRENLTLQATVYGLRGQELRSRVQELLERFSLDHAASREARTYSGGQQRRLDIAMGLLHRPRVLFLDEPTTGLDPETRVGLWAEIERLARDEAVTVLLTTHYLEEADALAHSVAIVDEGRIIASGAPDQLKGELKGDSVHVELAQSIANGQAREVIERVDGTRDVVGDGTSLHARVDNGASAVPVLMKALDGAGIEVASVTAARPSLDEVYLQYTGRSFHRGEEGTSQ